MQLILPPDLETLINKRLSSGGYASVEDVLRRALEAHVEEGYQQAERGELTEGAQARREIQSMKDNWRLSKR
jgi:Arc/MetJ-type ribon-helix-helix transcriptional regulator